MRNLRAPLFLVAVLSTFLAASPALGANTLGHRAGWDSTIKFNKIGLTAQMNGQVNNVLGESIDPTDITLLLTINQPAANWEVNVYDLNLGDNGWFGAWNCQVWGGMTVCTQGRVRINLDADTLYLGHEYTDAEAKSLVCEEIGHSVGLAHSSENGSCMSQQWDELKLSAHDKAHLNAIY